MNNNRKHTNQTTVRQGAEAARAEPLKIGAATPFDFSARNLTAYGGLLPVATMLEKLGFQQLVEETLSIKRLTRVMPVYQFVLAMVLALYVGFSRLHHLRFLEREPMLTGILKVLRLPPQCTFWRFLASLHLSVAGQILRMQQILRQRVWEAAHVELKTITLGRHAQHCGRAQYRWLARGHPHAFVGGSADGRLYAPVTRGLMPAWTPAAGLEPCPRRYLSKVILDSPAYLW